MDESAKKTLIQKMRTRAATLGALHQATIQSAEHLMLTQRVFRETLAKAYEQSRIDHIRAEMEK